MKHVGRQTDTKDIVSRDQVAGILPLPTDTTKSYNYKPGTGWVEASSGGGGSTSTILHLTEEAPSSNLPPTTPNPGSYQPRALNTVRRNTIVGSSLSAGTVTLPQGTYRIRGICPGLLSGYSKCRLYNATAGTVLSLGSSGQETGGSGVAFTHVYTEVVFSSTTNLRLEHRITSSDSRAYGEPTRYPGEVEVYAQLVIEKVA